MLYKPSYGKFKDNYLIFHNGVYYLYSMFTKNGEEYRSVWLAKSDDGVHWHDVGEVIKDAGFYIWAMAIHKVGDMFIMNHGSFGSDNKQNTLKFWKSYNLEEWEYMGEEYDVTSDNPDDRLDCMNVFVHDGMYYGYAAGPGGFLKSSDGINWQQSNADFDFSSFPVPVHDEKFGYFEVGDCRMIDGEVYYLGGMFNYIGRRGYGVYTFKSDSPEGMLRPDAEAFRLCGNTNRWISMWARFCDNGNDLLVTSYMQDGYSYECGNTWMPPLKKAITENGHLRLSYWHGNDVLMGECMCKIEEISLNATEYSSTWYIPDDIAKSEKYDISGNVYIKGSFIANRNDRWTVVPSVGIILNETESMGTTIWLHGYGETETGVISFDDNGFVMEDRICLGCASPAGIIPGNEHEFILIVKDNMYEFYLDGYHITTSNTTHFHDKEGISPEEMCFAVKCGNLVIKNVEIRGLK